MKEHPPQFLAAGPEKIPVVNFWVNEFGLMVNERPRFVTPEEAAAIVEKEWVEGGHPPNIIRRETR